MKNKVLTIVIASLLNRFTPLFAKEKDIQYYIDKAPFEMPDVVIPIFPDRSFSITDYGAVGDGHTLNTEAFASAIKACKETGGGKVIVPSGIWLTGPVELKNDINLHVERGAIIQFTSDHSQYPMVKATAKSTRFTTASPIYGYGLTNIAITGEGIIDGAGESWRPVKKVKLSADQWEDLIKSGGVVSEDGKIWWPTEEGMNGADYMKTLKKQSKRPTANEYIPARDYLRPYMVYLSYCENILIEGVSLRNSPKFILYPSNCTNLTIQNINVFNEWYTQNGDGIDISACRNVIVYKCDVNVGDDAICMKSGGNSSDEPGTINLENVIIAGCNVYHGHGGLVIGSNTDGGMQNIFVSDLNLVGTDIGIRVKSGIKNGGTVRNIYIENIYMSYIQNEAISFNTFYENRPAGYKKPKPEERTEEGNIPDFGNFFLENIYCLKAGTAMNLTGGPEWPLHEFSFENIVISAEDGVIGSNIENISFNNVKIFNAVDPVFAFTDSKNIILNTCVIPETCKVFMKVSGSGTSGIIVSGTQLPEGDNIIQLSEEVDRKAVSIE